MGFRARRSRWAVRGTLAFACALSTVACGSSEATFGDVDGGRGQGGLGQGGSGGGTQGTGGSAGAAGTSGSSGQAGGGGVGGGGHGGDGGSKADAGDAASDHVADDASDARTLDAARDVQAEANADAAREAGTCAGSGNARACIACCDALYPGAFQDAFFGNECLYCTAACGNTRICSGNAAMEIDGPCFACAQPYLGSNCRFMMPKCDAFVGCLKQCPTN